MSRNAREKESIVYSDANLWQEISKWLAGILGTLGILFGSAIRWWVGDRFKKVDARIDSVEGDTKDALDRVADHDTAIARIEAYSDAARDERAAISSKLDTLIEHAIDGTK